MLLVEQSGKYQVLKISQITEELLSLFTKTSSFFTILKSSTENSVVIESSNLDILKNEITVASQEYWSLFRLAGSFDFDQAGVLAGLIAPISAEGIGIFVISSFDTDYLLIQQKDVDKLSGFEHFSLQLLEADSEKK